MHWRVALGPGIPRLAWCGEGCSECIGACRWAQEHHAWRGEGGSKCIGVWRWAQVPYAWRGEGVSECIGVWRWAQVPHARSGKIRGSVSTLVCVTGRPRPWYPTSGLAW